MVQVQFGSLENNGSTSADAVQLRFDSHFKVISLEKLIASSLKCYHNCNFEHESPGKIWKSCGCDIWIQSLDPNQILLGRGMQSLTSLVLVNTICNSMQSWQRLCCIKNKWKL